MKTDPDDYLRQLEEEDRASWLDHEAEAIDREEELKRLQADLTKPPGREEQGMPLPPDAPSKPPEK